MKKRNIIIFIGTIIIISLFSTFAFSKQYDDADNLYDRIVSTTVVGDYTFNECVYDGHKYIIVENKHHQFQIIHDPDCWDISAYEDDGIDYE